MLGYAGGESGYGPGYAGGESGERLMDWLDNFIN